MTLRFPKFQLRSGTFIIEPFAFDDEGVYVYDKKEAPLLKIPRESIERSGSSTFLTHGQSIDRRCVMPLSTYLQISTVLDHVMKLNPVTILDVGCGIGIYGALCRVYLEGDNLYDREKLTWNRRIFPRCR